MLQLLFALAPLFAAPVATQTPPKPPAEEKATPADDRADLKKRLDKAADLVKSAKNDDQLLELVRKLHVEFKTSGPKDRDRIAKLLAAVVIGRHKAGMTVMSGVVQSSLGEMGAEGRDALQKLMIDPELENDSTTLNFLAYTLVGMNTPESLDVALKLLEEKKLRVFQAVAAGLGNLHKAPAATRKRACAALVAQLAQVAKLVEKAAKKKEERETLLKDTNEIVFKSVTRISSQASADMAAWLAWWKQEGEKADWPEK